jgi:glycine betaine catabolism B
MNMTTYEKLTRPSRFTDPTTWGAFGAQWHSGEQKTLQCCAVRQETQ